MTKPLADLADLAFSTCSIRLFGFGRGFAWQNERRLAI